LARHEFPVQSSSEAINGAFAFTDRNIDNVAAAGDQAGKLFKPFDRRSLRGHGRRLFNMALTDAEELSSWVVDSLGFDETGLTS